MESIKFKYACSSVLPPQFLMTGVIKRIESLTKVAAGSMSYMMYGNIGLQIFLSVSMQLFWGKVNTLQLVINMNLLSVLIPANVQFFFGFLVDIVTFKVIPIKPILHKLFKIDLDNSTTTDSDQNIYQQAGFEGGTNFLQNLGFVFLAILGTLLLILSLVLAYHFTKKFKM